MGKVKKASAGTLTFTPLQQQIFDEFAKDPKLTEKFYFTGGTALSAIYLHHRESEDLDFFSEEDFDNEYIKEFMTRVSSKMKSKLRMTLKERVRIFELVDKKNKLIIKVDFGYYPHSRLQKGKKVQGVDIDSLPDIAANKITTILQRTEIKDFVDLYYLLQKYTIWDLLHWSQLKFNIEIDLIWLSSGLLKAEQFDYLPTMQIPLKLSDLKNFYRELTKKIGRSIVTK